VPGRSPDKCKLIPIEEEEQQEDPQTAALRQRCTQQALAASDAADIAAGAFPSTHQPAAHMSMPFLPSPGQAMPGHPSSPYTSRMIRIPQSRRIIGFSGP
jgi:hypothetical protein